MLKRIYWNVAGLVCLQWNQNRYALHIFVKRKHWTWGLRGEHRFNFGLTYVGLGPFFLLVWVND